MNATRSIKSTMNLNGKLKMQPKMIAFYSHLLKSVLLVPFQLQTSPENDEAVYGYLSQHSKIII
jgi:hypothetical protein